MTQAPATTEALMQAAEFLVDLQADALTPDEHASITSRLTAWRTASPDHEWAWQRVMAMGARLQPLSPQRTHRTSTAILSTAASKAGRRKAIKQLACAAIGGAAGLVVWRQSDTAPVWLAAWGSDIRTGTGERRNLELPDGSRLQLNADSAVSIAFSAVERTVRLISGELYVHSAPLPPDRSLPLRLTTRHGRIEAGEARFGVRQREHLATGLFVDGGRVEVGLARAGTPAATRAVRAGESMVFEGDRLGEPQASRAATTAWTRGMLIAQDMPLGELLAELSLFRSGYLGCDPAIASLRINGTFPLRSAEDTDRALRMLVAEHALAARYVTRYWTRLSAAA